MGQRGWGEWPSPRYVHLVTFRRDGREVGTPVWIAEDQGRLFVYSERQAGKVKRIRATGRVRAAPCTFAGKVIGTWREGRGRIVDDPETIRRAFAALARKYGWQFTVGTFFSRLTGRIGNRVILELMLGA